MYDKIFIIRNDLNKAHDVSLIGPYNNRIFNYTSRKNGRP